jgi:cytoskeletal protein CcmA (bactofilin family)
MDSKSPAPRFSLDPDSSLAQYVDQDVSVNKLADEDHTVSNDVTDDILSQDVSKDRSNLSVIGPTLKFKGDLVAEEDLLIQGSVKGTINHRAKSLTIGTHGNVTANIVAQNVIVQGTIQGEIRATESVVVEPSAHVVGDIYAPRVGLKEGAKFKGSIDMDADPTATGSTRRSPSGPSKKKAAPRSSVKNKSTDESENSDDAN